MAFLFAPSTAQSNLNIERPQEVAALAEWGSEICVNLMHQIYDALHLVAGAQLTLNRKVAGDRSAGFSVLNESVRVDQVVDRFQHWASVAIWRSWNNCNTLRTFSTTNTSRRHPSATYTFADLIVQFVIHAQVLIGILDRTKRILSLVKQLDNQ